MKRLLPVVLLLALPVAAQEIKMPPGLDKLAAKASEVVDVNLDGALLQLASKFLSDKDPDEAHVKQMVGGLKGIFVKSFEFDEANQYNQADIEEFRAQFRPPVWSRIVSARSKRNGENSEILIRTDNNQISGLVVIVTEPKELTIVNIIGNIRPEDLRDLGGKMGIPKIDVGGAVKDKKSTDKKEDEK
jgi:hypothetical protein